MTNRTPLFPNIVGYIASHGYNYNTFADYLGWNSLYLRRRLKGEVDFSLPDIQLMIDKTGKSFEYLFTAEVDK